MAHSMGCAVIWAYIDLYGQDRIGRQVLVAQAPCMFPSAEWSPEEMERFGCFYKSADEVDELAASAMDCVDLDSTIDFVRGFFTTDFPEQSLPFIAQENLKFPRHLAAQLLREPLLMKHHTQSYLDPPHTALNTGMLVTPSA